LGLFEPVVPPAKGSQIALASPPVLVIGAGVVKIADRRGTAAAGRGAGTGPSPDQPLQRGAGPVAGLALPVIARSGGQRLGGDGDRPPAARPAAARPAAARPAAARPAAARPAAARTGAARTAAARAGAALAGEAGRGAVGERGAVGGGDGDLSPGGAMPGDRAGQHPGRVRVDGPVPGGLPGGLGQAEQGGQRHGQVHQPG
jgi:hypothetical protein